MYRLLFLCFLLLYGCEHLDSASGFIEKGDVEFGMGNVDQAMIYYNAAAATGSLEPGIAVRIGRVYMEKRALTGQAYYYGYAAGYFRSALASDPGNREAARYLGIINNIKSGG